MADKETLISSIKKLRSLNVSDDEILSNLSEVGIDKTEAKILLKEAKRPLNLPEKDLLKQKFDQKMKKEKPEEEKQKIKEEIKEIKREVKEELQEIPVVKSPIKLHAGEREVWEKGVLTVVNERLDEVERIRDNITEVIDSKVQEELRKESKKNQVLMESQRELLTEKIDSFMEAKSKELFSQLNTKIDALKELKISVSETSKKTEEKEKEDELVLSEIKTKLSEVESSKMNLVKALKNEMEELKNESKQFMFDSTKQIEELNDRVNKALELESKITEGLITNAEKKVQEITIKQTERISNTLTKKLNSFEELTKTINPKKTEENIRKLSADFEVKISNIIREKENEIDEVIKLKIKEIEEIKRKAEADSSAQKLAEKMNLQMQAFSISLQKEVDETIQELENTKVELKKFIASQLAESSANSEEQLEELVKERKKELDAFQKQVIKNTNLTELTQKVAELDVFKEHFIKTIRKNLEEIKEEKEELGLMVEEKEKELDKRVQEIDSKMKELDDFEKAFAKEMGVKIEALMKAKSLKQEVTELKQKKQKETEIQEVKKQIKITPKKEKPIKGRKVSFKSKSSAVRGIR